MLTDFSFDIRLAITDLLRVSLAFALAFPLAWDRQHSERNLGLRTFPLVAIASCGFYLIASSATGANADTLARVVQGIITGIGFIGGGAILKENGNVRGLATAASIWNTAAIGIAVGSGREEIAVVLSLINFLLLRYLRPFNKSLDDTLSE